MTETPPSESYTWHTSEDTRDQDELAAVRARARAGYERQGWIGFAALMLATAGVFQVILGLTALLRSGVYAVGEDRLVVEVDYTAWGWVHLVMGAVAIAAAVGLPAGRPWARVSGIAVALVSAVINLAFLPAYPFGASLVILLDVLIVYGIAVHGRRLEDAGY